MFSVTSSALFLSALLGLSPQSFCVLFNSPHKTILPLVTFLRITTQFLTFLVFSHPTDLSPAHPMYDCESSTRLAHQQRFKDVAHDDSSSFHLWKSPKDFVWGDSICSILQL